MFCSNHELFSIEKLLLHPSHACIASPCCVELSLSLTTRLILAETTSMKGLILAAMDRKEEAFDLAKKGLTLCLASHVCWHVLGLLHKGERNYVEAQKAYKRASVLNPVRDLTSSSISFDYIQASENSNRHFSLSRITCNCCEISRFCRFKTATSRDSQRHADKS